MPCELLRSRWRPSRSRSGTPRVFLPSELALVLSGLPCCRHSTWRRRLAIMPIRATAWVRVPASCRLRRRTRDRQQSQARANRVAGNRGPTPATAKLRPRNPLAEATVRPAQSGRLGRTNATPRISCANRLRSCSACIRKSLSLSRGRAGEPEVLRRLSRLLLPLGFTRSERSAAALQAALTGRGSSLADRPRSWPHDRQPSPASGWSRMSP
jgi:hypothetical protein